MDEGTERNTCNNKTIEVFTNCITTYWWLLEVLGKYIKDSIHGNFGWESLMTGATFKILGLFDYFDLRYL